VPPAIAGSTTGYEGWDAFGIGRDGVGICWEAFGIEMPTQCRFNL